MHGANRAGTTDTPRVFFEGLPQDDPHHVPPRPKASRKPKRGNDEANGTPTLF